MKTGIKLIADERKRQIEAEGFTAEHDAHEDHQGGELSFVAENYCRVASTQIADQHFGVEAVSGEYDGLPENWPLSWDKGWWKPSDDPIRNLVKAGALIAAEIDRLQGKEGK